MPIRKLRPDPSGDDPLAELRQVVAAMSPGQLKAFALTLAPDDLALLEQVQREADESGQTIYRSLHFEPICAPRVQAAFDAGFDDPIAAEDAGVRLPKLCGRCPQERFDAATEFDVFYGGAAGGGKTLALLMLAIKCCVRWPGFRALFLRETFDQLDENVFPELRRIEYASAVGGHWNAGRKELDFAGSPSAIRFRYLANLEDVTQRQGASYQLLCLDERTQLPPGTADGLRDRLRSTGGIPIIGYRSTGNPGGRAHGELKRDYVVATGHGAKTVEVRKRRSVFARRFIPAKATDNPYLNEDYFDILDSIEDPNRRRAMRDGDWSVFAGQFFTEWSHDRHVVPRDAVELDRGWLRYEGIDYGRAAPWCMLRGALDGDRRLWLYREMYETGVGEREQARRIRDDEVSMGDTQARRAGDPSMWGKVGDADPIAETYRKAGVPMVRANNNRTTGWARVHSFLADAYVKVKGELVGAPCPYHASLGWETCPLLHVLEDTCPNLVRTLPDLPFDPHKVEDLDTRAEDHAADALRYLVMNTRSTLATIEKPSGSLPSSKRSAQRTQRVPRAPRRYR